MAEGKFFIGIDVGSSVCKGVAIDINGNTIVSKTASMVMGDPEKAATQCLKDLSRLVKDKLKSLKKNVVTTGHNGDKISFGEKISEITCIGKGAYILNPDIRIIVDVGSFTMKAIKIEDKGKVKDFMMNDRCAAGAGILLELVAEGLELHVSELADIALKSTNPISISSQCSIFAESEVISYKNEGSDIADLVAGVCNSVAGRIYPLTKMLEKDAENIAFAGGVAKNKQIVQNLEKRMNKKLIEISIEPEYIAAFGAAILARKSGGY